MTPTKPEDGKGAGDKKFRPILLMVVHFFRGRVFFLVLKTCTCTDVYMSFFP